ncbi:MAG: hypothetical protein ACO37F_13090, partial [Pirellulales bacterium]
MAITTTDKSLAALKEEICDIGRRIYNKGFAAGNDDTPWENPPRPTFGSTINSAVLVRLVPSQRNC